MTIDLSQQLSLQVRSPAAGTTILDISGQLTAAAEPVLMEAYSQASAEGMRTCILNFADLEYMNSTGIGLLVTLLVRANRQHRRLLACGLSEHYRQIFELTRLDEAIGIHPSETEALAAAAQR